MNLSRIICILFINIMSLPSLGKAPHKCQAFKSKKSLFAKLYSIGLDNIYAVPFSKKSKIMELKEDGSYDKEGLATYSDIVEVQRMPNMDYLNKKIAGTLHAHAFLVGEVMLCYRHEVFRPAFNLVTVHRHFKDCYIFPANIRQILKEVSREEAEDTAS